MNVATQAVSETRLWFFSADAAIAVYDNPQTTRSVDYVEFYDGVGNLLQASWLDKYGIRRTAVDRALLQEDAPRLEGILVLLLEGDPV